MSNAIERYVQHVDLASWAAFKSRVDAFPLEWIYRGQGRASWHLESSLDRSPRLLKFRHDIESVFIAEYQRAIQSFPDLPAIPNTSLEWLALLQHHGTPTRLIDFSKSPYVAAYFAFLEEHDAPDEPVAVWCVDRTAFYQAAVYYLEERLPVGDLASRTNLFSSAVFERLFSETNVNCIMPFDLAHANARQLAQQAVFLAAMSPCEPFAKQLGFVDYQKAPVMHRLTIPRSDRSVALRDLMKMNITHATLFPGIDGFARSLNLKYSTLATVGDIAEWHAKLTNEGFAP